MTDLGDEPGMQSQEESMNKNRASGSHHSRIIAALRQSILDGSLPPGRQLPRETELAGQYGVSRMTMNKALTQLTSEGFLVRRKRSGTFVAQPRGQAAVMEINDIEQEVAELGFAYAWRLNAIETRSLTEAERSILDMAPEPGGRTLVLEGLHMARGEPFCLELRAINPDAVPAALEQDFNRVVPGQWLLRSMPFSAANHRVRAINAAGRDARLLDVALGTACLEILRKTWIEQTWVTHVRLLYSGELHQLVADFAQRLGVPSGATE